MASPGCSCPAGMIKGGRAWQNRPRTDPSSVFHFQDRHWGICKDHLNLRGLIWGRRICRSLAVPLELEPEGEWGLLALPSLRGLHKRNICLAATSSHVFERIRKICYYKTSAMRLEFIGSHAWGCWGLKSHARRSNMPMTLSLWPPSSKACACPKLPKEAESCCQRRTRTLLACGSGVS